MEFCYVEDVDEGRLGYDFAQLYKAQPSKETYTNGKRYSTNALHQGDLYMRQHH